MSHQTPKEEQYAKRPTTERFPDDYTPFIARNATNENGRPAGGFVKGVGIEITFQDGPLGDEDYPSGAFVEHVLEAALQRVQFYQDVEGGRYKCLENEEIITHLELAIAECVKRQNRRGVEGTLGTHAVSADVAQVPAPLADFADAMDEGTTPAPAPVSNEYALDVQGLQTLDAPSTPAAEVGPDTVNDVSTPEDWDAEYVRRVTAEFSAASADYRGVYGAGEAYSICPKCGDWHYAGGHTAPLHCDECKVGVYVSTHTMAETLGMPPRPSTPESAPSEPLPGAPGGDPTATPPE